MFAFLLMMVFAAFGGQRNLNGDGPNRFGAQAAELTNPQDAKTQELIDQFKTFTDKDSVLANPQALTAIKDVLTKIVNKDPQYQQFANNKSVLDLAQKMLDEINIIQKNPKSDEAKKAADSFLKGIGELTKATTIAPTITGTGNNKVPVLKQGSGQPWSRHVYGTSTISSGGCAIVSAAMVLKFYSIGPNDSKILIEGLADQSVKGGARIPYVGTDSNKLFKAVIPNNYSVKVTSTNWSGAKEYLKKGIPVIVSGKANSKTTPFTSKGHFVVLTGIDSNNIVSVNNPAHSNRSYPESIISRYAHSSYQVIQPK